MDHTTCKSHLIAQPTGAGVPHKMQVQAATVAGLGKGRVVEEVLFSEEQGIHYVQETATSVGLRVYQCDHFHIIIYNIITFYYIYL